MMSVASVFDRRKQSGFPLFLLIVVALAFKSTDALVNPQFWAEDGTVFFKEQYGHALPQIFAPYAGYLLAVPRLVAWLASLTSPTKAPLIYNTFALLLASASIAFTACRLRNFVPIPLILASFLIVPTNGEIFGTLTNLQWFLQFALAASCLSNQSGGRGGRAIAGDALIFLMAITGPFSIFIMGVVALLLAASRIAHLCKSELFDGQLAMWNDKRDMRTLVAAGAGAVLQILVIVASTKNQASPSEGLFEQLYTCFANFVPIHIFGFNFMRGGWWIAIYATMLFAIAFGKRIRGEDRLFLIAMIGFAAMETFAPMRMKEWTAMSHFGFGDRYFYLFKVVFWWAAYGALTARSTLRPREVTSSLLVLMAMVALINPSRMQRLPFANFEWKKHARELKTPGPHEVPINPRGWTVTLNGPEGPPSR